MAGPFIIYGGKLIKPVIGQIVNLSPGSQLIHIDLIATDVTVSPLIIPSAVASNISGTSFTVQYQFRGAGVPPPHDLFYFGVGLP